MCVSVGVLSLYLCIQQGCSDSLAGAPSLITFFNVCICFYERNLIV